MIMKKNLILVLITVFLSYSQLSHAKKRSKQVGGTQSACLNLKTQLAYVTIPWELYGNPPTDLNKICTSPSQECYVDLLVAMSQAESDCGLNPYNPNGKDGVAHGYWQMHASEITGNPAIDGQFVLQKLATMLSSTNNPNRLLFLENYDISGYEIHKSNYFGVLQCNAPDKKDHPELGQGRGMRNIIGPKFGNNDICGNGRPIVVPDYPSRPLEPQNYPYPSEENTVPTQQPESTVEGWTRIRVPAGSGAKQIAKLCLGLNKWVSDNYETNQLADAISAANNYNIQQIALLPNICLQHAHQ
jgi:hypothetical protein